VEALIKLEANPVVLIFVDIRMPRMDGIELLKKIHEKKLCPCVVLLSDYTEYGYAREGIIYDAFDYISKSIPEAELKQLLERIRKYLDNKYIEDQRLEELREFVAKTYYTQVDTKNIARQICNGEADAVALITEMTALIEKSFAYDTSKALMMLKSTMMEIVKEILSYYEWLSLYVNVNLFFNSTILNGCDWVKARRTAQKHFEELVFILNCFMPCHDNVTIRNTCEYILLNVHEELSVSKISEKMYISKAHLSEIFKQRVGITLLEYITMTKMERAKVLMMEQDKPNYEIAFQLGYREYGYFNKVFKKYTGVSFTIYRKRQLGEK
jgi:two-component system, response regulator YesN